MSITGSMFEESPQRCELCGLIAETRPYGPDYEEICIDCAKKDEGATLIRALEILLGIGRV